MAEEGFKTAQKFEYHQAVAEYAQFFSFGTNDLTQMTFGFSRDDAEAKFLNKYVENKILTENPIIPSQYALDNQSKTF